MDRAVEARRSRARSTSQEASESVEPSAIRVEDVTVAARDGYPLAATSFRPAAPPGSWVVVNSATAVPRAYYARFARFLAEQGFAAVTYDYRGIGGSRPRRLRGFRARMRDWAQLDAAGVMDWVDARHQGRVAMVGHSFGGQALGLLPRPDRLAAAVVVGSQSGYWRHWPGWRAPAVAALWHAVIPALCRICGYFPASALRMGKDMPAGVAQEWAEWGRQPGYVTDADGGAIRPGYARIACPIRSYSFSDDTLAPPRAVEALLGFYPAARIDRRALTPRDLGVRAVGHWGFFRDSFREPLWLEAADWLRNA
jgi:predicted alpha/beta hydrolase